MKRGTVLILIAVFVAVIGLSVLFLINKKEKITAIVDPYKAVPLNTCLLFETDNLRHLVGVLSDDGGMAGELKKMKGLSAFEKKIKFIADSFNHSGQVAAPTDYTVLSAILTSENEGLGFLMIVDAKTPLRQLEVKQSLNERGLSLIRNIDMADRNVWLYGIQTEGLTDSVYVSVVSNLLVCTSSITVLNKSFSQLNGEADIRNVEGFNRLMSSSGKHADKIFVIFENLPAFVKPLFNDEFKMADKVGLLASCAEGDIYLDDNSLIVNGYVECPDSSDLLFNFKNAASVAFETYRVLPAATALFETMSAKAVIAGNISANGDHARQMAVIMKDYIGGEITKAYVDIKDSPVENNFIAVYRLADRNYAEKVFMDHFKSEAKIMVFSPDDQVKIPVYKMNFNGFGKALASDYMWNVNDEFFTFYNNCMITGSSYEVLSKLLYDNILNKTLSNDMEYREFETTLPSMAGFSLYMVPRRLKNVMATFMSRRVMDFLSDNKASLDKLQAIGYRFSSSNNMLYNCLSVRYEEEMRHESETEWESLLETEAAVKPYFFTNHNSGAKEIFIQDRNNNIYLINSAGRILWKVPVKERINGTIYTIDYYRNGKYQLLFSSRNYLHLIDRNGNYVERYPVKLRSPATNSLALFDYENNRNYRILIAGEDRVVYAYDKSGNTVKGWKQFRTNDTVTSQVSWVRLSGKDYLIVTDESSIYFLDRRGNKRLTLKDRVSKAEGSSLRFVPTPSPSIVCSSKEGVVQHIMFDGSVKKSSIRFFSKDHCFDTFDCDGDGDNEYIFIDKGVLYLYDNKGKELFSRSFDSEHIEGPIYFVFSSFNRGIGVYDADKKLIYIIDSKGDIMPGFPLGGASLFSIGKLSDQNSWNLIVGGNNKFLYNYRLDIK